MNFDCIEKNAKKVLAALRRHRKDYESVTLHSRGYTDSGSIVGCSAFDIAVPGDTDRYPINITWTFCPFCGVRCADDC